MSDIIARARALRTKIEELAVEHMEDDSALDYAELFPVWDGEAKSYVAGDRVRLNGTLYKVLQAHTSQPTWSPDTAPSLFAQVLPGQDGTEIGEWVQPGAANAYMTGDRVRFNGKVYESLIDNNVWSPSAYPQGWKEVT